MAVDKLYDGDGQSETFTMGCKETAFGGCILAPRTAFRMPFEAGFRHDGIARSPFDVRAQDERRPTHPYANA